jgi:heat shock protein HslJ
MRGATLCFGVVVLAAALPAASAGSSGLTAPIWTLRSLAGEPLVTGTHLTMDFSGGRVSGSGGCNRYSAAYRAGRRTLRIEQPAATTRMACAPSVATQEIQFLAMLAKVRRYSIRSGTFTLRSTLGKELARLEVEPQELAGTAWRVNAYNNGKQAVVSVSPATKLTAVFSKQGNVSGTAGCNTYRSTYQATPPKISFGPIATTRKTCSSPEEVMAQEAAFLAALASGRTYTVQAGKLELRTASGSIAVELAHD